METIETVIIGAGQAGLATAYAATQRGHDCVVLERNQRRRRRLAPAVRLAPALLPRPARRPARAAVPGRPAVVPRQGRGRRLPPVVCRPLRPARSPRRARGAARSRAGGDGFVVTTDRGSITCATSSSRPGPSGGRRTCPPSPPTSTRRSSSCTRASTAGRASCATARSSSSAPRTPAATSPTSWPQSRPTVLAGRDCGQIPVRWDTAAVHVVFPFLLFAWRHVLTRRTPMGRKDDGRDPPPRRTDAAGQARGPRGARRRAPHAARRRASPTGCPTLDDGTVVDAANVVWATGFAPALRLDRPAGHRRGRLAPGVPRRRRRRARPLLLRARLPVRVRLDGAARRRARRGPRRRAVVRRAAARTSAPVAART